MAEIGFTSTRGAGDAVGFSQAMLAGLAGDGGLYVPSRWPRFASRSQPGDLADVAAEVLHDFFAGDGLEAELRAIAGEAFNFPAPLRPLSGEAHMLELFHGPTAAFKDFGARFLAASMARLPANGDKPVQVLVATSGDTGGAVAAAFHNHGAVKVSVLYPKGLVSPAQERQLNSWGANVAVFAVKGSFDDCQRMVKQAFADASLRERYDLTSANSINVARLLGQMAYFAWASLAIWNTHGAPASFVIPSGNLGHATACAWAQRIGLPIDEIVLAHNANRTMPDYLASTKWRARPSVATLASAMDVGDPSNFERLHHLYPSIKDMRGAFSAYAIEDEAIRTRIRIGYDQHGAFWCPHTAVAAEAFARHGARGPGRWVVVATAHAAKFPEVIEPILGRVAPLPPSLAALEAKGAAAEIEPTLGALIGALE